MKFRIAAGIAVVLVAVSLGAWLWFGSDAYKARTASEAAETAAKAAKIASVSETDPARPPAADIPNATTQQTPALQPAGSAPVAPFAVPPGNSPAPSAAIPAPANPQRPPPAAQPPAMPAEPPPPAIDPEQIAKAVIDADKVSLMLRDYRTRMGENPIGTNAEIMAAVMGGNPKRARLGPPEGQQLNGNGELVDRWGTPYFFHQLSRTNTEVRSAGPDRIMHNEDDVIAH